MKYITGIESLNLSCKLNTCGDWHNTLVNWNNLHFRESNDSIFGNWGIEVGREVNGKVINVANHLRAILDLMVDGHTNYLKFFYKDFIGTDKYNKDLFDKVIMLKNRENWTEINKLMQHEFMSDWDEYVGNSYKKEEVGINDRDKHYRLMVEFLKYINEVSSGFVFKGGTSLMMCYGLTRFSEDLDFDGFDKNFIKYTESFIELGKKHYNTLWMRVGKDTDTVKRVFIHFGEEKPLKIEVSYRKPRLFPNEDTFINGIHVYNIDSLFRMKLGAFQGRDKIRDLFDITYVYNKYKGSLSSLSIEMLVNALSVKGLDQFDYLMKTQYDPLIDYNSLAEGFLNMYYDLGFS